MKTHKKCEHLSPSQGQEMILAHVGDSRAVLCQQGRAVRDLAAWAVSPGRGQPIVAIPHGPGQVD